MDALVNDSESDHQGVKTPLASQILEQPKRATPTMPPGFSVSAVPISIASTQPVRPLSRSASSTVAPAVPLVPASPGRTSTPGSSEKVTQTTEALEAGTPDPITAVKSGPATPSKSIQREGTAKPKPAQTPKKSTKESVLGEQKESKPATESPPKLAPKSKTVGKKSQASADAGAQKSTQDISAPAATPTSSKRQHPGKLDIAAATKLSENEQPSAASLLRGDTQPKPVRAVSMTAANSVPASPAATSMGSPIKKSIGAKTLRVVATPKTENPPPLSAMSTTSLPHVLTMDKLRSRQASIASLNQPGTPASEMISDTASITSASISRASSPPPVGGKVGTAPMRKKTKSQAKKERQERARQIEEERTLAADDQKSEPEVVQAPIIGRKKKAKKLTNNPKSIPTPVMSQPESPRAIDADADVDKNQEEAEPEPASSPSPKKAHTSKASISSPRPKPVRAPDAAKEKREPTAQSIIADLQRTGELIASTLEFFKPLSSSLAHASRTAQTSGNSGAPPDLKIHFSEADLDALSKKHPVRLHAKDGKPDSRTLITPQGKFFWGLTQELEEKALELEKHIEELKGAARFHARKQTTHQQHTQNISSPAQSKDMLPALATALKEAGAKLSKSAASGQPMPKLDPTAALLGSTLPLPPVHAPGDLPPPQAQAQAQQQTPSDAGAYLNQFVLPKTDNPPTTTPRPEMAAVGGPPGAGTVNVSVNVNKIAKAAKAVAEGGVVGTDLDGTGVMAADLLGGVFVQGLEALVGAGLGLQGNDLSMDVQGLASAFDAGGMSGRRGGRRSVLSVDEAEQAMQAARKDHEALEKKLTTLMKRNKKLVNGGGRA